MENNSITTIILSGGQGRRLNGQDKGLLNLNDEPLVAHAIRVLKPQTQSIIISANRNSGLYQKFGYTVISDKEVNFLGPLAGISSAMSMLDTGLALVSPCDTPFLPGDLASRLHKDLIKNNADIAMAHDGNRLQHMCCLIRTSLADELNKSLASGQLKAQTWMLQQRHCIVDFSDCPDCFFNINQAGDLAVAELRLKQA